MTKLKNGTWVIIADGEKALFLENQTDGEDPFLEVFREEGQENPPNRDQAANRRGRFNDGPSVHRSAVDDTDWHQLAKDRFAGELADILYQKAHAGAFEQIVLVAPPGTLGELRHQMHQEVSNKVIGEIDKTLTNHALDDIEKIVVKELQAA
ncbi:host attachment family protein [Sulfitobacter geojensis]|jgi:protein required for attachment to host cells|uniref:Host attachment protein n=1 Tax=Sulfitobacter geojensis TaxID=1342299 RepID=A0AAE2VWX6_9RHOB|nr:host attachment family protein [Sulfitobacter geojensis]MBM1688874.1 host attachment protein [Sulfitobacter geojensis]MBM1692941.1 host attachment protein [Sulfitobacter geojensis]MBM1705107.1 host attachment protein [Sulfitobacter geojensis]MBM1709165.1 host attachment protein [Sulfitobacter geojensis]MBM1713230.1 host attachment protein [Sulfitobacter geojensis]